MQRDEPILVEQSGPVRLERQSIARFDPSLDQYVVFLFEFVKGGLEAKRDKFVRRHSNPDAAEPRGQSRRIRGGGFGPHRRGGEGEEGEEDGEAFHGRSQWLVVSGWWRGLGMFTNLK